MSSFRLYRIPLNSFNDTESKAFHKSIRQFNAIFALKSFQYGLDNRTVNGLRVFQDHGLAYHTQHPLQPLDQPSGRLRFAQTWVYDGRMAFIDRVRRNSNFDADIIRQLIDMLLHVKPYIQIYRTAYERLQSIPKQNLFVDSNMNLISNRERDSRHYDLPTTNEVAAVIPDHKIQGPRNARAICLSLRYPDHQGYPENTNPTFQRIDPPHPAYLSLYYVRLFSDGDRGWSRDLRLQNVTGRRPNKSLTVSHYFRLVQFP